MKIIVTSFFLSIILCSAFAQQDPEAKKILDQFSKKSKAYTAFKADFTITMENHQSGEKTENSGNILLKGNKYKMQINNSEIYFDGKDVYSFTRESNEVSIMKPNKNKDDNFLNDPSKLFNIYTKDYKFRLLGETNENNHNCYEIDLYPIDLNKKYSIIKLLIDKDKLELISAKTIMKSGVHYILKITSFNNNAVAIDKDFSFDIKTHKGVEVVDMR